MHLSNDVATEVSVTPDKGQSLLGAFHKRYGFFLELFHRPSDATLSLLIKLHAERSADFVPLSRVANLEEGRDFRADTPARAKIGKEIMLVLENSEGNSRKTSDYFASGGGPFLHAVRILMFSYALASAAGEENATWFDLQAAVLHIAKQKINKLGIRNRGHTFA